MEQDTGVEPAFTAWEAVVLPIYESCVAHIIADPHGKCNRFLSAILRLGFAAIFLNPRHLQNLRRCRKCQISWQKFYPLNY